MTRLTVLYFAWMRERIGHPRETIETRAATVAELIEELRTRSEGHALALADLSAVRVAVDKDLSDFDTALAGAREVALFPPMTGG